MNKKYIMIFLLISAVLSAAQPEALMRRAAAVRDAITRAMNQTYPRYNPDGTLHLYTYAEIAGRSAQDVYGTPEPVYTPDGNLVGYSIVRIEPSGATILVIESVQQKPEDVK